ncbi:TolC family protein [bacterium]|nr:TolC family protein [bacterium]
MIKKLSYIILVSVNIYAYSLTEILDHAKESHSATAIKEKAASDSANEELFTTYEAPHLGLSSAHARAPSEDGMEYGVSFSQNISKPFGATQKENASKYAIKAIEQKMEHELHIFTLEVTARYHNACVSNELSETAQALYDEQSFRVTQLQKAYDLGEISKQSLLFHKLDLAKLHQMLNVYKRNALEKTAYLNESVDNLAIDEVECGDLVEIRKDIKLGEITEHGEIQEIGFMKQSTDSLVSLHNTALSSLGYELMYNKELDTTRYTFGVKIPIDFLSSQQEVQKAKYLHLDASIEAEKNSLISQIQEHSNYMLLKVQTLYDEYTLYKEELVPMSFELKELSKSARLSGEGNMMEHLDSTRSYTQNVLEMLQIKQKYYDELFELYKTADLSLGEHCANIH